jgi:hypothetical protein
VVTQPSGSFKRYALKSTANSKCYKKPCLWRIDSLNLDGRILVLAYHSLEDRIVKQALMGAAHFFGTDPGSRVTRAPPNTETRRQRRRTGNRK